MAPVPEKRSNMLSCKHNLLVILLGVLLWTGVATGVRAEAYRSPCALTPYDDGRKLLVAHHTARMLSSVDLKTEAETWTLSLPLSPTGIAVSPDGKLAYVTIGPVPGALLIVDLETGKTVASIPVGHSPTAPVVSHDGQLVYVCNRFENAVSVIDLKQRKRIRSIPVKRDPVAACLTPDGANLYVSNHMPDGRADVEYVASKISVIDTATQKIKHTIKLVNGAEGVRRITTSTDGKFVFVVHLMARFQVPTSQIERGWIATNAVSVISVADQTLRYTVLLDDVDKGFANPWAVAVNDKGTLLAVSSAGGNELRLIDLPAMNKKIQERLEASPETGGAAHLNVHNDLTFLSDISRRVELGGVGPRDLAIVGDTLWVAEYYSDSLGKVQLAETGAVASVQSIPLGPRIPLTLERQGEIFFNDSRLCFQNWLSCASCHAEDGRMDALNWDLLNDGMGNPKNVKSLLLSHKTPPVMALGVRDRAETAVRAGLRYIQFVVRPEKDAVAVDAFLKSLKPMPSPHRIGGELSASAKRGEKIFEKADCTRCHPAPLFTDLKSHNVGTGTGQDAGKGFDTPTLVEVWRTAPYMHDGRAETIYDVIKLHNPGDKRGKTSELTDQEIRDLAAYCESL